DEAMMNPIEAQHLGAHVGSVLTLDLFTIHMKRTVRVVGIGLFGGQIDSTSGGYIPLLVLTRALYQQHAQPAAFNGTPAMVVTLRGGRAALAALQRQVPALSSH